MTLLQINIPDFLQKSLYDLASRVGVSVDQLVSSAVAEKISALMAEDYLKERAKRGSRAKYDDILAKVSEVEPDDKLQAV